MLEFSVGGLFFAVLLILVPVVLRFSGIYRREVFLTVNIAVFALTFKDIASAATAAAWVLIPYFAAPLISNNGRKSLIARRIFYVLMLAVFLYLMHYDWIFIFRYLPYSPVLKFLGLSYLLFREVDYTMQYAYLKESKVRLSLADYLNYLLSFYTIMAGPIMRYEDFVNDFYREDIPELDTDRMLSVFQRIIFGYIQVYVISALMSSWSAYWFDRIPKAGNIFKSAVIYLIFSIFNALFIYFNFVGYCDIVVGGARLSGMTLKENFDRPYLARSMVEFWNRHHISLSEWIRDYIYSPIIKALLSGSFRKRLFEAQCAALFATFLIAGIWHGTNLNYLVYGLLEGLGVVLSSVYSNRLKKKYGKKGFKEYEKKTGVKIFEHVWTCAYVCLSFSFVGYDVIGLMMGMGK